MLKKILFFILLPFAVLADDCVQYKKTPFVNIKNPEWTKTVELSDDPMDEYNGKYFSFKLHGITETSFMEKYKFEPNNDIIKFEFLINLKKIYNLTTKDYSTLCNKFLNGELVSKKDLNNFISKYRKKSIRIK